MSDKKKSILALMYDFDKTLCTENMQEYSFIPRINMSPEEFWNEIKEFAKKNKMDNILAYMYKMIQKSRNNELKINRNEFVKLGNDLEFFPGVEEWFDRINILGNELGVEIQHFIISSGLREVIEGSTIFKNFKEVYACEFLYDVDGIVCWPKNAINYTTKTQFLFRINKGILDVSNNDDLNRYTKEEERPIPFRNMIYIGDGLTDVPCMKLVKVNGGYSIALYKDGEKDNVDDLLMHNRVDFIAVADYSENSELDKIVKNIICKISMDDSLKKESYKQMEDIKSLKEQTI